MRFTHDRPIVSLNGETLAIRYPPALETTVRLADVEAVAPETDRLRSPLGLRSRRPGDVVRLSVRGRDEVLLDLRYLSREDRDELVARLPGGDRLLSSPPARST